MLNITAEQRQNVLRACGLENSVPFAIETEAEVYARDNETLLKLYTGGYFRAVHLEIVRDFYEHVIGNNIPLPKIQEITQFEDVVAVIEMRLKGRPLEDYLADLQGDDPQRAENLYLDAIFSVRMMRLKSSPLKYAVSDHDHANLSDRRHGPFEAFYAARLSWTLHIQVG